MTRLSFFEGARSCRKCGCTDRTACVSDGLPCWWHEEDLCSVCAGVHDHDHLVAALAPLGIRCYSRRTRNRAIGRLVVDLPRAVR